MSIDKRTALKTKVSDTVKNTLHPTLEAFLEEVKFSDLIFEMLPRFISSRDSPIALYYISDTVDFNSQAGVCSLYLFPQNSQSLRIMNRTPFSPYQPLKRINPLGLPSLMLLPHKEIITQLADIVGLDTTRISYVYSRVYYQHNSYD